MRKQSFIVRALVLGVCVVVLFFVIQEYGRGVVSLRRILSVVRSGEPHHERQEAREQTTFTSSPSDHAVAAAVSGVRIHVTRVIDGDTIELSDASGHREHLRYIGIDTPEAVDPRKAMQCFAKEATQRNRELVENKDIIFYKDISDRDMYGRLLGFIYLVDGTLVNNTLVAEGYAFAYPYKPDVSQAKQFKRAQDFAREHHLGLWRACSVSKLPDGHEQTNIINVAAKIIE